MSTDRIWQKHLGKISALALTTAALSFALWPVSSSGELGNPGEALACNRELSRLAQAVRHGQSATGTFTERQLNAHLASLLEHNPQARQGSGLSIGLEQLRLATGPEELSIYLRGRVLRVPFQIEFELEECGRQRPCSTRSQALRLGRLRLVPPLKTLALWRMKALIKQLNQEGTVLHNLQELRIYDQQIILKVAGESTTDA